MPGKAATLLDMLGVDESKRTLDHARIGTDFDYGKAKVDLGRGVKGALFPPLISDE
jgi:methionyl-tRNA synthetase